MSYSMRFVVTPLPANDDILFDCIKDAATRPSQQQQQQQPQQLQHSSSQPLTASQQQQTPQQNQSPNIFRTNLNTIRNVPVSQIAVGPRHVGLLLEDGRIFRAPYHVQADRLEFPPASSHVTAQISSLSTNSASVSSLTIPGNYASHLQSQHTHSGSGPAGAQISAISKPTIGNSGVVTNPPGIGSVISPPSNVPANLESRGGAVGGGPSSGNGQASSSGTPSFSNRINISPQASTLSVQHRQVARRGRMFRHTATRGRGSSVILGGGRSVIPAHYVPEDLINQAQVVLQGKPRSAIVRELQRTNLDVNSAVNNLLSSDNEDPEDMDESQDYLPNEDLISLLDSSVSLPSGPTSVLIDAETVFPEDVFNHYPGSRLSRSNFRHSTGSSRSTSDRESSLASELEVRRMSARDTSSSRRWLEHALRDPQATDTGPSSKLSSATPTDFTLHHKNDANQSSSNNKKSAIVPEINPIQISDTLEQWPLSGDRKFVRIACMHSELIAISSNGQIHQWKWSEPTPFEGVRHSDIIDYHPKTAQLNLTHEKVHLISASCVRTTVVTESFKVATWIDDTISTVASKLEHGAQNYPEFQKNSDKIAQLDTCSLFSCIRLESGALYWWGVAPFSQRKKNWKKIQSRSSKHGSSGSSNNDIGVGSIVCLKNGPSFGDGAIGFTTKDGIPRVGRLTMSAWSITDTCAFKIIQPADKRSQHSSQSSVEVKSTNQRIKKILGGQPIDFSGNVSDEQAPSSPGPIAKSSTSSASERIEMPPPPSPASSTCSEPGCSPSHKRKHKHPMSHKDEDKNRDEEQWNLKDVIFLEEVKKPPAAKVIKLDGNTALVRFNQRDPFGNQSDSDVNAYLQDCRMIRKDELQLAKETTSSSRIIDCQRSPKKISIPDSSNFITFTVSNIGIHAIVKTGSKIEYKMYQLGSGKVSKSLFFPTDTNAFLGRDSSLIALYACGESDVSVTLRDGNGSLYPLARDFLDSIKEPQPLDLPPIQAMGMAVHPVRDPNYPNRINPTLVMAMAIEKQILIPSILGGDPEIVRLTLTSLDKQPVSQHIAASEKIDLNRNILHTAVCCCAPTPTRGGSNQSRGIRPDDFDPYPTMSRISSVINETIKRSRVKRNNSFSQQQSSLDLSSDSSQNRTTHQQHQQPQQQSKALETSCSSDVLAEWSNSILDKIDIDPSEQKQSAHLVLLILVECPMLRPFLKDLMTQRDAHGMTPFMTAVSNRAYTAALILLDLAKWIVNQEESMNQEQKNKLFYSMIFPTGTNLDNNPLYMLCANDTCSFTWTGAQHINQDIFECKTCGLTKTLCCCTECARTCHKGHDCRLKKTSPTAYCDCWEKCKCKSLVAGSHFTRFRLLERLLEDSDLVTYPDSRGESILSFLVQTVGRQIIEQRQYTDRSSRHNKRDDPTDMPDHDMSPPRFARKALHKMLGEWLALKSVIMSGTTVVNNLSTTARSNSLLNVEDQMFLSGQQGTALLDRFTHSLLIKIGPEMLDVLLSTIIRESSSTNPTRVCESRLVAKRFVRSVARNGVVLSVELSPVNYSQQVGSSDLTNPLFGQGINSSPYNPTGGNNSMMSSSSWKPAQQPASILQKCRKAFQALLPIAAEELAEIADALISPVRLGVPRPTAPFSLVNSMVEATQGSEEIFVVDPVVLPTSSNVDSISNPPDRPIAGSSTNLQPEVQSVIAPVANNEPATSLMDNSASDRMRDMLYDNEIAMEAIDSEDADASNNTFRRSNNGESDSDSDSNMDDASLQSNIEPSGPRSSATGATIGSEVGTATVPYFSEPESGDSSNAEEDEESEANDTEHENDDIAFAHEDSFSFSRRATMANSNTNPSDSALGLSQPQSLRSTNLGQQLHWALRHRDHSFYQAQNSLPSTAARLASIGLANAYNYLDGAPNRRSVMPTSGAANNLSSNNGNELSMSTTAVGLSRAFSIIIRSISDLIPILKESERSDSALTINQLKVSPTEAATIICNLERKLNPVWEWLFKVMDSTEGQLRFGCALTNGIQAMAAGQSGVVNNQPSHTNQNQRAFNLPNTGASISPSTSVVAPYLSQQNPYPIPVHPAMLARANPNLIAQNLGRRVPNLFEDTRAHGSSGVHSGTVDTPNIRLQIPLGSQSSSANRPQSLTTRSSLDPPNFVRMPLSGSVGGADNIVDGAAARRDFLSYMISLIRGHGNEHHDSLPILDVSSLRHVAYVFDAYVYYLKALNHHKIPKTTEDGVDDDDLSISLAEQTQGARHQFFRRSESTLYLDGIAPDPFSQPLSEALPLAEQPHLLQPNSRREDLFGISKSNTHDVNFDSLPIQLSLSAPSSFSCNKCIARQHQVIAQNLITNPAFGSNLQAQQNIILDRESILCPIHKRSGTDQTQKANTDIQHTALLGRWRLTVELFGREFLDDVGAEPGSILTDLVGFPLKENRFRREMERLRSDSAPRDISLTNIYRDKNILIRQTIKELNNACNTAERNQRRNIDLPPLACSKVKVSFNDEKGEGNGVARSFYTAFCEAVLSNERLASFEPLFYQPGLRNFYSPRQGDPTVDRLNAFRNVGRVIGICLSQSEICPIQLNRHVIKYILRKPISWHDLAFFDPILYESLRQLVLDAETHSADASSSALQALDLRFCVDLSVEEGGGQVELAPGGKDIEVTTSNIYEYVRRYALKRMLKSQQKALEAIRRGVMDALPSNALDNLTAEDFRLLLNGVGEINIQTLISYTTFIDDRGTSASKRNSVQVDEQLGYFKKWFWSIVEKMTTKERQDLVYFWTGSPSLPASEEGFQPMPTVSIRPAEDLHLPSSNVCIFRLYIPLYSSKAILRSKLLIAIKEKNFGFV